MGNQSGHNVAPVPPQSADTQRETGSGSNTAQDGGIIMNPQIIGATVRDVHLTVHQHGQSALTETASGPPKDKDYIIQCQSSLKSFLKEKTENLFQGPKKDGSSTPLDQIFTELYITKGGSGEVNTEHEVIHLELKRCPSEETAISLNDIFQPLPNDDKPPRRVLTKGIAGIGKTVSVRKFTRDWARGDTNQTYEFLFPFTFRELNQIKDERLSLKELITRHFKEVQDLEVSDYDSYSILFIFDGLDESKLDFKEEKVCRSVTEPNTVDVLLTNLISRNLLSNASVWITSRPAASMKIPLEYIDRVTEVRGFNDEQKEEYFLKKVTDKVMALKIFQHLQSKPLRSLFNMCHIPVVCWISATVLQKLLKESHEGELPKTLTEMYIHFLKVQTKMTQEKDYQDREPDRELIMKLGKLAFEQLKKGNVIFDEDALRDCEIDPTRAAPYSGLCTQIIKKEHGLHNHEMYCFIHLSVQEFLAALYVLETFIDHGVNLLGRWTVMKMTGKLQSISFLHSYAVDLALASNYGQWDLFLRFLLGLSQDKNQSLIQKVFGFKPGHPMSNKETVSYIHQKIKKQTYSEHSINLFHCLNELGDHSLVDQVLKYQSSGDIGEILPAHWSALAYNLLISNEDLDLFDLRKFCRSEGVLERLLPLVKVSTMALLICCSLSERSCGALSSVLSSQSSSLRVLDLSNNDLKDSGVELLSTGLKSPHCRLETLSLSGCMVTEQGCSSLASILSSSCLTELDLSYNHPGEPGEELLSALQEDPDCNLETLRLDHGGRHRMRPGPKKYTCELEVDTNTVSRRLRLSENNRTVTYAREDQPYPDHPDRFHDHRPQLLCRTGLTGRCYWEVEWRGWVYVSVSYRGIRRRGESECVFGWNDQSWILECSDEYGYSVRHNKRGTKISSSSSSWFSSSSGRVGVYLDHPAGSLSFYRVYSDRLILLHTFNTTYTEPLYPGFWLLTFPSFSSASFVSLCSV